MCGTPGIPDRPRAIKLHRETAIDMGLILTVNEFLARQPDHIPFVDIPDGCINVKNPIAMDGIRTWILGIIQREGAIEVMEARVALLKEHHRLSEFANSLIPLMNTIEYLVV